MGPLYAFWAIFTLPNFFFFSKLTLKLKSYARAPLEPQTPGDLASFNLYCKWSEMHEFFLPYHISQLSTPKSFMFNKAMLFKHTNLLVYPKPS